MSISKRDIRRRDGGALQVGGRYGNCGVRKAAATDTSQVSNRDNQPGIFWNAVVICESPKRFQLALFGSLAVVKMKQVEFGARVPGYCGGNARIHSSGSKYNHLRQSSSPMNQLN